MAQKARNQLQAPRRTASPWREATSESLCPDPSMGDPERGPIVSPICERHEDYCEEIAVETRQPEQPDERNIVRQTTIVWQNILANACPRKQRKMPLEVARQTSKRMWHRYETARKRTSKTRPNHRKSFTDTGKQNDKFQTPEHSGAPSCTRNHKDIKLAKIMPESLTSNGLGLERGTNTKIEETSSGRTLYVDFEIPSARHGNKTILPSLQKVI